MTYCISDLHGCYDEFMALLGKINFSEDDTLYVLGDAIDRGPDSVKCLKYIMGASNINMLAGNHERMMIDALTGDDDIGCVDNWLANGGTTTLAEFCKLSKDDQINIVEFVMNLPYLAQVKIGEQNYVLVHAGLNVSDAAIKDRVSTRAILPEQYLEDLVWIRERFYRRKALPNSITVFGHTPIPMISRKNGSKVWRDERFSDKIGIDGGCAYGGSLLALRLDDMAEFAVNATNKEVKG